MGEEQQTPLEGDRQELSLPEEVPDQHHGEAEELFREFHLLEQFAPHRLEIVLGEGV